MLVCVFVIQIVVSFETDRFDMHKCKMCFLYFRAIELQLQDESKVLAAYLHLQKCHGKYLHSLGLACDFGIYVGTDGNPKAYGHQGKNQIQILSYSCSLAEFIFLIRLTAIIGFFLPFSQP